MIFQDNNLLTDFSALENIMMPLIIKGEKEKNISIKTSIGNFIILITMACLKGSKAFAKRPWVLSRYSKIPKFILCMLNEMFFAVCTRALHAVVYIFLNILFDIL